MHEPIPPPIVGDFCGVRFSRRFPIYDCRWPADQAQPRAPWGDTLWSGERAAYALGLLHGPGSAGDDHTSPLGIQFYFDARDPQNAGALRDVLRKLRSHCRVLVLEYRHARRHPAPKGQGGHICYRPVAMDLGNYGAGIICDRRAPAVGDFRVPATFTRRRYEDQATRRSGPVTG